MSIQSSESDNNQLIVYRGVGNGTLFQCLPLRYTYLMKKKLLPVFLLVISLLPLSAYTPLDKSSVNSFDRFFMTEYSSTQDTAATVLDITLAATPLLTAFSGEKRLGTTAVMYAETFALAWGAKELLKYAVNRERPYLYFNNPPDDRKDDWEKSFPSGHTTLAFASAAFTAYTFNRYNPESRWRLPVTLGVYTLAAATAVLRVTSGSHFVTDVLAGAALGTLIGFAVPYLHTLPDNVRVGATPFALAFNISF